MKSSDYIKRGRGMDMNSCSICHGPQNFGGQIRHTDECPVKALAEVEERAQRAERELAECRMERDRMQDRAVKYYVEIAALTPLADEGRKHLARRLAALELIESGEYHPKRLTREMSYDIDGGLVDIEIRIASDGIMNAWYELTDKGHERLAYLRGRAGEGKQSNDDTTT